MPQSIEMTRQQIPAAGNDCNRLGADICVTARLLTAMHGAPTPAAARFL
jgi:hypothetical protein